MKYVFLLAFTLPFVGGFFATWLLTLLLKFKHFSAKKSIVVTIGGIAPVLFFALLSSIAAPREAVFSPNIFIFAPAGFIVGFFTQFVAMVSTYKKEVLWKSLLVSFISIVTMVVLTMIEFAMIVFFFIALSN